MDEHQSVTGYQRLPEHPVEQPQHTLGRFQRPINQHFAHIRSFYVGVGLMIVGLASIHLNILDLIVSNSPTMLLCDTMHGGSLQFESLGFVGHGIWTGIMCVIAGGFAVGAGHSRTNCQIRASIVLNIIAAMFCVAQFGVALTGAIVVGNELCWCSNSCSFKKCDLDAYTLCRLVGTLVAAESLLTILGVVGFVTSIYLAALGCRSACCCDCSCCRNCCGDCCGDCCPSYQPIPLTYSDVPVTVTQQQHPTMPTSVVPQQGQHPAYYGQPTGQEYSTVARPSPAYQQQPNN